MRWPNQKISIPLFVLLFLSVPLFSQTADFQTAWMERVVDGDTLLPINGKRAWFIAVDFHRAFPV